MDGRFFIERADVRLACTDAGAGPTLVLLHAGGERRSVWKKVAEPLGSAGFRTVAVDQRGHGETGGRAERLSDLVDDASAVLDALGVPVVLVGASLGGMVSLLANVRDEGHRVRAVVLVDVVPDPDADLARAYLRGLESESRRWNWALVEDILAQAPLLRDAAARSRVPIALVRGEHGGVREEDAARLRALVPSLVVRTVEGAGHLVARERPAQLAEAIVAVLGVLPLIDWSERR